MEVSLKIRVAGMLAFHPLWQLKKASREPVGEFDMWILDWGHHYVLPKKVYWWNPGSALGDKTQQGSTSHGEFCFQQFLESARVADRKILPPKNIFKG